MKTPESYEKADICKYLDAIEAWHFKPMMNGFGKSGVPDIVACISGVMWGIEVKREGKTPTPLQNIRMSEIRMSGGLTAWGVATKVCAEIETWRNRQGLTPIASIEAEEPRELMAATHRSRSGTERRSSAR